MCIAWTYLDVHAHCVAGYKGNTSFALNIFFNEKLPITRPIQATQGEG